MIIPGAVILALGLVGIGFAKRISAKKGSNDTMGYVLGVMFVLMGFAICWKEAGPWLLSDAGFIQFIASGVLIMAGLFYAVKSFAYVNAEFDKP